MSLACGDDSPPDQDIATVQRALFSAVNIGDLEGQKSLVEPEVAQEIDPNARDDQHRSTLLGMAAASGHYDNVKWLLSTPPAHFHGDHTVELDVKKRK